MSKPTWLWCLTLPTSWPRATSSAISCSMSVVFPELCRPTMEIAGLGTLTIASTFTCAFPPRPSPGGLARTHSSFSPHSIARPVMPQRRCRASAQLDHFVRGRPPHNGIMAPRRKHVRSERPAERMRGACERAAACVLLSACRELPRGTSGGAGTSTVFAAALLATLALAGGMLALRPRAVESLFRRTATPFVAAALLACGAAAPACLDLPSPDAFTLPALTLAGAVLVAAGTAALVALALERLRHDGFVPLLATVAAALLGASLLWYVLNSFRITVLGAAAVVAAAFAAAVLLRLPHQCGGEPAAAKTPPAVADARTALGRYWGALFGLAFNFFTMGLTFWPSTAGVSSNESVLVKPGAYAMVLAVVVVAHLAHRRFGSPHENEKLGRPAGARHAPRGHGHRAGQPLHRLDACRRPVHRSEPAAVCRHRRAQRPRGWPGRHAHRRW